MSQIASSYGMSRKTLYIHRLRICRKYGFKTLFPFAIYLFTKEVAISSHLRLRRRQNADQF